MSTHTPPSFNPRDVPVLATTRVEPAVALAQLSAQAIRERFKAQVPWVPDVVKEPRWGTVNGMRAAAVLLGLVQRDELHVVLTRRSADMPTHAGQVAFPGGKVDAGDASVEAAALREAYEEIGVPAHCVDVLGRLGEYTTGTGFHIIPVVALMDGQVDYRLEPREVDVVFEVPLSFVTNPANHRRHMWERDGVQRHWWSMPYTDPAGAEHFIWGATAGMLRNFYQFLSAPMPL